MDLQVFVVFGQEVAKMAALIPREFGGGASRAGRRPIRATKLLDKTKPKAGFPPSKVEEDDKNSEQGVLRSVSVNYTPAASITSLGL